MSRSGSIFAENLHPSPDINNHNWRLSLLGLMTSSICYCNLRKKDILCLELFSWHSYKFGKVRNKGKVFKEYILEPLLDTKVKYVFLLRAPIIEAAEQAGISLKTIEHNWKSSSLNVKIGTYEGIIFIATKNFMKGYPGTQEDKEVIKRKIKELEDNLSRKS